MSFLTRIDSSPLSTTKDVFEIGSDAILSPIRCLFGKSITYIPKSQAFKEKLIIKTASIAHLILSSLALLLSPLSLAIGIPLSYVSSTRTKAFKAFQSLHAAPKPTATAPSPTLSKTHTKVLSADEKYASLKHLYPVKSYGPVPTFVENMISFYSFGHSQDIINHESSTIDEEEIKRINRDFIRRFKEESGSTIATPDEFLVSMNQYSFKPKPIPSAPSTFLFQEEQPYHASYGGITKLDLATTYHWGYFLKKEQGKLYLYADGSSYGYSLIINGIPHFQQAGRGAKEAYCLLNPGDTICTQYGYIGVVDAHGNIVTPSKERLPIPRSKKAIAQINDFHESIVDAAHNIDDKQHLGTLRHLGIIKEKFEEGFSQISKCGKTRKFFEDIDFIDNKDQELIIFDPSEDETLIKLKNYFEQEFEFYEFSTLEKITRLNLFLSAIFQSTSTYQFDHHAYLIGELLHSGQGVCRHRAFALKSVCDLLDIPITYVAGLINTPISTNWGDMTLLDNSGHAWCVFEDEDSNQYVVDPMRGCIIKKEDILSEPKTKIKNLLKSTFGF